MWRVAAPILYHGKNSMKIKIYVVAVLCVVWGLLSWHWYTCEIKGFCGTTTDASLQLDAAIRSLDEMQQPEVIVVDIETVEDCTTYLTGFIRSGDANDAVAVERLEKFLNAYEGESLDVNGEYGDDDAEAINRFQEKYSDDVLTPWGLTAPTGNVLTTTRDHINTLYCAQMQGDDAAQVSEPAE